MGRSTSCYIPDMLSNIAEVLHARNPIANPAVSTQAIAANPERNGLSISLDAASSEKTYIKLGTAVATLTDWDFVITGGQMWPGLVGAVVWQGAVQVISSATPAGRLGIAEV